MNASQGYELAIDLGTSNTTAAARVDGRPVAVLFGDEPSMPSGVLLLDGVWHVGNRAKAQWRAMPKAYEPAPKRRVGAETTVHLGGREVATVELLAAVLAEVRRAAQQATRRPDPDRVVLTHPVAWAPSQVAQLQEAARRAGFRSQLDTSVTEPVAAARRYEAEGDLTAGPALIFDLGGGTCDVAVLGAAGAGPRQVLAAEGDEALGGRDLDARLFHWVVQRIEDQGDETAAAELRTPGSPTRLVLLDVVRLAKEELTDHESAVLPVRVGGLDTAFVVQKSVYEGLIANELAKAAELVRRALGRAQVAPGSVGALYLTGGAAQTPAVVHAVQQAAGVQAHPFTDLKLVVAEGALRSVGRAEPPRGPVDHDQVDAEWKEQRLADARLREAQLRAAQQAEAERVAEIARLEEVKRVRRARRARLRAAGLGVGLLVGAVTGIVLPHLPAAVGAPTSTSASPSAHTASTPAPHTSSASSTSSDATPADQHPCWDGSVDSVCPTLTGASALEWAYSDQVGSTVPMACVSSKDPLTASDLVTELTCTWSDLPNTSMELYEFTSASAAKAWVTQRMGHDYPGLDPEPQFLTSDPAHDIGSLYSGNGTFDGTKWQDIVNVYDRLPFVSWISTDVSTGGTSADTDTAYKDRLGFLDSRTIDEVLRDGRTQ